MLISQFLQPLFITVASWQPAAVEISQHSCVEVAEPASKRTKLLDTSEEPDEIIATLISLSRSDAPGAIETLINYLNDPRLDRVCFVSEHPEIELRSERLRRVLRAVAIVAPEKANETLLRMGKNKIFLQDSDRRGVFFWACTRVRQPSPELLDLFEDNIGRLAWSRTPLACERIEKFFFQAGTTIPETSITLRATQGHPGSFGT
jgi:hypothetical protein